MRTQAHIARGAFYEALAPIHHEIYRDWRAFCSWQHARIAPYAEFRPTQSVLDASCSIGTQMVPLAQSVRRVVGCDVSAAAVRRAHEAMATTAASASWHVATGDFLDDEGLPNEEFDTVLLLDNAISHALTPAERATALLNAKARLRPGGRLVIGLRDYRRALSERPSTTEPAIYEYGDYKRIVHQVWNWGDDDIYEFHLHIVRCEATGRRDASHLAAFYRASEPAQVADSVVAAGFRAVDVVAPEESGYHQCLLVAVA